MTSDLMMVIMSLVGNFLGVAAILGIIVFAVFRMMPGRASVSKRSGAVDGVVRAVRVTLEPDPFAKVGVRIDRRLNQVCIDADTPHGRQRFVDRPVRPNNLPMKIRRQVYSLKARRHNLNFNIDDEVERRRAAASAEHGGYEFQLARPLPVSFIPPKSPDERIRWQLN